MSAKLTLYINNREHTSFNHPFNPIDLRETIENYLTYVDHNPVLCGKTYVSLSINDKVERVFTLNLHTVWHMEVEQLVFLSNQRINSSKEQNNHGQ